MMNHVSAVDPFTAAHIVYDHGRLPRYLAKASLFRGRFMNFFMTSAGQIPVERLSAGAAGAFDAAVQAVRRGECVVVYPEGTITRDPDGWPMKGKSGAARIALETGCPVYPVGQWGAQRLLPAYSKRVHLFPRTTITMKVGEPVDLSDLAVLERTTTVVDQATERIMGAVTALVGEVRGETPPPERFDPRRAGVSEIGDPVLHAAERGLDERTSVTSAERHERGERERPRRRPRRRLVGDRVLGGARRRRQRRHHLGPPRGRGRGHQPAARELRLPARHASCRPRSRATHDVEEALSGADVVVLATPSQTLRDNLTSGRR